MVASLALGDAIPLANATIFQVAAGIPVPIQTITYSASSSAVGHPPNAAAQFVGTWWQSVPGNGNPLDYSTWLVASFPPTPVRRVLIHLAFAALTSELEVAVWIQVQLQGSTQWTNVDYVVSQQTQPSMSLATADRFWVLIPGAAQLMTGIRAWSYLPMGVRELIPFADQSCYCTNPDITSLYLTQAALGDLVHAFTNDLFVLEQAKAKVANVNPNATGPCIGNNDCVITVSGVQIAVTDPAAQFGSCADVLGYLQNHPDVKVTEFTGWNVTSSTVVPYPYVANISLNSSYPLANATLWVFGNLSMNNATVWAYGNPPDPRILYANAYGGLAIITNATGFYGSNVSLSLSPFTLIQYTYVTNVITYQPPIPLNQLCPSGTDVTRCGPSNRLRTFPGMTCSLTDLEKMELNGTAGMSNTVAVGALFQQHSPLVGVATLAPRTVQRVRVRARCEYDQCLFPEQRCFDGTCSKTCDAVTYTAPGSGCVESAQAPGVFSCVCKRGVGGSYCQLTTPTQADNPYTGAVDAYAVTVAGGPPPIRLMPSHIAILKPVALADGAFTLADLERINYAFHPQINAFSGALVLDQSATIQLGRAVYTTLSAQTDVINLAAQYKFSPYGYVTRIVQYSPTSGDKLFSQCPPSTYDRFGRYIMMSDCIIYDPVTRLIRDYVNFTDINGNVYQIKWANITNFIAAPYRCPNGKCQPDATACTSEPVCNGNGDPMPDGTCRCHQGFKTFFINPTLTTLMETPYDANNPTDWYTPTPTVWRYYDTSVCAQRDCTQLDCSPPVGCRPGTLANAFADADVVCSSASPRKGLCAKTQGDCVKNIGVYAPLVCRDAGIPFQYDYISTVDFPDWGCYAGDPINPAVPLSQVTDVS